MESILEQPSPSSSTQPKVLDHTSLHLLPCGIQHDGQANIPGFFFLVDGQYPSASTTETAKTTTTTIESPSESQIATLSISSSTTATTETTVVVVPPETSFRGRSLKATILKVPDGYQGSLYQPHDGSSTSAAPNTSAVDVDNDEDDDEDKEYQAMLRSMQEQRKTLKTTHQFKEFTVWGHDDQPTTRNDKVLKAMQWIDIANVLHNPLC
ncbi:hypothetical protein BGZ83_004865 [Gryganskiella cystojenkinii]|nr:hypothetical protein BGZ83_004865 [Gryganskiella cystojenkinii]